MHFTLFIRSTDIKKGKGAQFDDSILTMSVGVEAVGCEQLDQIRYAAAPEITTS